MECRMDYKLDCMMGCTLECEAPGTRWEFETRVESNSVE